ncbi:uncharacterized protein CMU_029320 [Cryptosporidium muris RN66]|uniref:Copper transport protein n=1 Tax=Cryptosporidium muris (strain RN66) TaxID=441375 RepID=B6AI17_CRYMR|nr:uncharacterized protein CMU_029320 [Cryptosporidium muris RN66]EEA07858.1 hypothetical protein CMU_029320 [Cryptosporidium muris RN66]|eukprot:XP_002142207.1 hypothetical protein [Cryptosporidium muris RN66]
MTNCCTEESTMMHMTFYQNYNALILFDQWKTYNLATYLLSCLVIILIGFLAVYVSVVKEEIESRQRCLGKRIYILRVFMAFISYFFHYILMLIAMTFNFGLFLSVLIGLSIGHGLLSDKLRNLQCNGDLCIC